MKDQSDDSSHFERTLPQSYLIYGINYLFQFRHYLDISTPLMYPIKIVLAVRMSVGYVLKCGYSS